MSWKVLAPIAAGLCLSLASVGCAGEVYVRTAPPADRAEVMTAAPSAEHFWVRGHWQWNGHEYVWAGGRWEVRRGGAVYQPGHWRDSGRGWVWVEGRWADR